MADGSNLALRREGDSNPRYSYPYGSLANCWFKPLTHLSAFLRLFSPNSRTGFSHSPISPFVLRSFSEGRLALKIGSDKNRQTYTKCKIFYRLFETIKLINKKPEIFIGLLVQIGHPDVAIHYFGQKP